jgi:hypothetical protein
MAKRKKQSKVQKRKGAPARAKARKPSKAAKATKRTVAKAKGAPVKKVARKVKQPVAPVVETVTVERDDLNALRQAVILFMSDTLRKTPKPNRKAEDKEIVRTRPCAY